MIQDALQQVQGAEVAAIAGMIILLLSFVAMSIWAFRLDRRHVEHMSNLPLDDEDAHGKHGADHG